MTCCLHNTHFQDYESFLKQLMMMILNISMYYSSEAVTIKNKIVTHRNGSKCFILVTALVPFSIKNLCKSVDIFYCKWPACK